MKTTIPIPRILGGLAAASVFTSRLNIEEAVLHHCTGKLAPDKVIGVVPLK